MKRIALSCLVAVLAMFFVNHANAQQGKAGFPPATVEFSQVRTLYSMFVKDTFQISVYLPPQYSPSDTTRYPVLYVTDANVSFAMVSQMITVMQGELNPTIVVGIGYNSFTDWLTKRGRDLTPVVDASVPPPTGGGPQFLKFIQNELFPFIDRNYKVNSSKSYAGFSYGGLFGLYTLFTQPATFQNYVIGSPSIWYGNQITYKYFDTFKVKHPNVSARLFMSVGGLEQVDTTGSNFHMIDNWKILTGEILNMRNPNMHMYSQLLINEDHLSGGPAAYSLGIRYIYQTLLNPNNQ